MTTECVTFVLADQGPPASDAALLDFLRQHQDTAVRVDATAVTTPTIAQLQILISAARARTDGMAGLMVAGMTGSFRQRLQRLGLPDGFFTEEQA